MPSDELKQQGAAAGCGEPLCTGNHPARCARCQRLAGMPTAPCPACPDHRGAVDAGVELGADVAEYRPPRSFGPDKRDCECPRVGNEIYHDRRTCTDPVARRLEWFGTPPPFGAEGGPRPTTPGATL